jgi:hypothetical protein
LSRSVPLGLLDRCEWADERASPEQRLFRHILLNAVLDAIYGATSSTNRGELRRAREEAMRWLMDGGEDFRLVCECAGLEPSRARTAALSYVAHERHRRLSSNAQRPSIAEHAPRGRRRP